MSILALKFAAQSAATAGLVGRRPDEFETAQQNCIYPGLDTLLVEYTSPQKQFRVDICTARTANYKVRWQALLISSRPPICARVSSCGRNSTTSMFSNIAARADPSMGHFHRICAPSRQCPLCHIYTSTHFPRLGMEDKAETARRRDSRDRAHISGDTCFRSESF